jgi:hypothetical protein
LFLLHCSRMVLQPLPLVRTWMFLCFCLFIPFVATTFFPCWCFARNLDIVTLVARLQQGGKVLSSHKNIEDYGVGARTLILLHPSSYV